MSGISISRGLSIFRAYLKETGRKESTITTKMANNKVLCEYLTKAGVRDLREVDRECMTGYARYLAERKVQQTGRPLMPATRRACWDTAALLFRALYESSLILANPMRGMPFARNEPGRVRVPLSEEEVAGFLDGIDVDEPFGLRDRALFELLYSSGLRSGEAAKLLVGDVDLENRLVKVRMGKFSKDRVVPMTENAAQYLAELIGKRRAENPVFRGRGRLELSQSAVNERFKKHLERRGLYREGLSVHALRHACATHLLAHGADLRYVQMLLGHESVETTVLYTNDLTENLRRRYLRAHPRENEYRAMVDRRYLHEFEAFIGRIERTRWQHRNDRAKAPALAKATVTEAQKSAR